MDTIINFIFLILVFLIYLASFYKMIDSNNLINKFTFIVIFSWLFIPTILYWIIN